MHYIIVYNINFIETHVRFTRLHKIDHYIYYSPVAFNDFQLILRNGEFLHKRHTWNYH